MGLFDKKPSYRKNEMRRIFEKSSGYIPFGRGRAFTRKEREEMFREFFGKEFDVSKYDYQRTIKRLSEEQRGARDIRAKKDLSDKLKFLRDLEKNP